MNRNESTLLDDPPTPARPRRRILQLAAEVLLILITVGLIVATWMPAIVGPSESAQDRVRGR